MEEEGIKGVNGGTREGGDKWREVRKGDKWREER